MLDGILTDASENYAYAYFGIIIVIALAEWAVPRRAPGETLTVRWVNNFALTIVDSIVLRVVFPVATITWAVVCAERGWGLLNSVEWPRPLVWLIAIGALDLALYGQHRLLHAVPILWRIHRTHHSDIDYDFTTGARFHPIESVYTTLVQFGAITLIGAPAASVFVAQVLSLLATFVEHGNVRIPRAVEAALRTVFVTPDMHRIHHSQVGRESRSNFSNLFSWWDRLFGTYVKEPAAGHDAIAFGLPGFQERKHATLHWMLAQPFLPDSQAPSPAERAAAVPPRTHDTTAAENSAAVAATTSAPR